MGNGVTEAGTHAEAPSQIYTKTWVPSEPVWVAPEASGSPELPAEPRASMALGAAGGLYCYPELQGKHGMGCTAWLELGPDFPKGALSWLSAHPQPSLFPCRK